MKHFRENLENVYFGPFWDRLDRILDRTRIFPKRTSIEKGKIPERYSNQQYRKRFVKKEKEQSSNLQQKYSDLCFFYFCQSITDLSNIK